MKRHRRTGKIGPGHWFALHDRVVLSRQFNCLTAPAIRLLLLMATKYRRDNNGLLICTRDFVKPLGWTYTRTLRRHLDELLASGLVCRTRIGGKNRPSLYAIAWLDCDVLPEQHSPFAGS